MSHLVLESVPLVDVIPNRHTHRPQAVSVTFSIFIFITEFYSSEDNSVYITRVFGVFRSTWCYFVQESIVSAPEITVV